MALNLNYKPTPLVDITTLTNEEWLQWRRKGIGGSDVASAFHLSPYRTARELYFDKIGVTPIWEGEDKDEAHDSEAAAQLVIKSYLDEISHYGIEGIQILTPLRKKGATSSNLLNERIRELVNPADKLRPELKCNGRVFRVGDRVIQTTNKSYASNGDIGVITGFIKQDDDAEVTIKFLDGREELYTMDAMDDLEFSYALTIHKSQGAEWPVVIIPLLKEHFIMLKRNLLYTAITRARKQVILVGQKQAVYMAIHRCDVGQRNTVLADRIVAYYDREQKKQIS